jgi:hypothetical protein
MAPRRGKGQERGRGKASRAYGAQAEKGERNGARKKAPFLFQAAPEEDKEVKSQEERNREVARTHRAWLKAQSDLGEAAEELYYAIGHGQLEKEARDKWYEARREEIEKWHAHFAAQKVGLESH